MNGKVRLMTKQDLRQLAVVGQTAEVLDWTLYDTLTIATGGVQTAFRFFQQAVGQGGISLERTNMEIPGQLPAGYQFVAQKLVAKAVNPLGNTAAFTNDQTAIIHRGHAQFFIGTRPYLQVPLNHLAGGGFTGFAGATLEAYATEKVVVNGSLEYSPVIPANYAFSVAVSYDAAPVVTADIGLRLAIVGKLIRPRQG